MKDNSILPVVNPTFNKTPRIHPLESFYLPRFSPSAERTDNSCCVYTCFVLPLLLIVLFMLLFLKII